jgi:hypothetical protein
MVWWELIISFILLGTCFITPLNFAFQKELSAYSYIMVINYGIDVAFFIDMMINFNLAFTNEFLDVIDNKREIFMNYF